MKILGQIWVQQDAPSNTNVVWIHDGVAKYFSRGKWTPIGENSEDRQELEEKVDSLDKEMGQVKKDLLVFGSEQGVVELEIGDSDEVKERNLAKLQSVQTNDHTFFTDINYGYGTAAWLPDNGGNAFIITNEGHAVKYNIGVDGTVTKLEETSVGLKVATKEDLGCIKAVDRIGSLKSDATNTDIIAKVNTIITALTTSGILIN